MRYTKELKRITFDFNENWTELFMPHKFAWINFNLVKAYAEVDYHTSTAEIEIYLLGLGFRVYWVISASKYRAWAKKMEKELKKEGWWK